MQHVFRINLDEQPHVVKAVMRRCDAARKEARATTVQTACKRVFAAVDSTPQASARSASAKRLQGAKIAPASSVIH